MIYIRIEMWPFGSRAKSSILREATITNVGGTKTRRSYKAVLSKKGGFKPNTPPGQHDPEAVRVVRPQKGSVVNQCRVEGFPHKQRDIWSLLYLALRDIVGERNK